MRASVCLCARSGVRASVCVHVVVGVRLSVCVGQPKNEVARGGRESLFVCLLLCLLVGPLVCLFCLFLTEFLELRLF